MFSTLHNLPGVYRQISLTPKYYYGNDKIVVIPDSIKITQEEIFTSAVYQIETCASKVVFYFPPIGVEKEIPTDDVVTSIKSFYEIQDTVLTVYHSKNIFAITNLLYTGVPYVVLAGYNYKYLDYPHADETIDVDEKMHDGIDTVEDLLDFVSEQKALPEDSQ